MATARQVVAVNYRACQPAQDFFLFRLAGKPAISLPPNPRSQEAAKQQSMRVYQVANRHCQVARVARLPSIRISTRQEAGQPRAYSFLSRARQGEDPVT